MGWAVLYIAFGIVALWLLGEVLLQYKARLRWRLLAFVGFLGVVLGVLIPSVVVIGLGAIAFAVGQTYVTLSFRRGFDSGWAVRRGPDDTDGRRGHHEDDQEPAPEASGLEAGAGQDDQGGGYGQDAASHGEDYDRDDYDRDDVFTPGRPVQQPVAVSADVYEPQPMPDDTGSYGIYGDSAYATAAQAQDPGYATTAQGTDQNYAYDYSGYAQQQYGYDTTGQQQYAEYSDPYLGTQTYGGTGYDTGYAQQYQQQGYGQEQYGQGGYGETASGGVWVPQQRTDETYGGELPQEQPYPYQDGSQQQGNGYGEYRY